MFSKNKKVIGVVTASLIVSVVGVSAFQGPTEGPSAGGFQGFLQHLISGDKSFETVTPSSPEVGEIGLDIATGDVDSSQVVQNPEGDLLERVEFIQENMLDDGGVISAYDGNVGIGTTTPSAKLWISSSSSWQLSAGSKADDLVIDNNGGAGISMFTANYKIGSVRFWDPEDNDIGSLRYHHVDDSMSLYTNNAEQIKIDNAGNVGIGTATPGAKLEVAGDVKIGNSSATCDATTEGSFRYNSTEKYFEGCDGTEWGEIGGSDDSVVECTGTDPVWTECGWGRKVNDNLVTTPSGCVYDSTSATPTCNGGIDDVTKAWGAYGITTGVYGLSNGEVNTITLVGNYTDTVAAKYCADMVYNGYDDWFLPAREQLMILYQNRISLGGFNSDRTYASSTEGGTTYIKAVNFYAWTEQQAGKNNGLNVRCIRSY